jgi:transposase-like protein
MTRGRDAWRDGHQLWDQLRTWLSDAAAAQQGGAQALDGLSDVSRLRQLLDRAELAAVRAARRQGHSWAEIATRLGVTRQSAWERWRDLDEGAEHSGPKAAVGGAGAVELAQAGAAAELISAAAGRRRRRSNVTVPDVVGLSFDDARSILTGHGLVAVGPDPDGPPLTAAGWPGGVVTDQSPESGARVPEGSHVTLWLGHGGGSAGVREPRRPVPGPKGLRVARTEPTDESVG